MFAWPPQDAHRVWSSAQPHRGQQTSRDFPGGTILLPGTAAAQARHDGLRTIVNQITETQDVLAVGFGGENRLQSSPIGMDVRNDEKLHAPGRGTFIALEFR